MNGSHGRTPSVFLGAFSLLLFSISLADQPLNLIGDENHGWLDAEGRLVPDGESIKSIDGFGGSLVVTPDADWVAKWETPHETVPIFSAADTVVVGQRLTILTFFINPRVDANGNVNILCDLLVIRPDGTRSVDLNEVPCVSGRLMGDPANVRLSPAVMEFVGEPDDPIGVWKVEVRLNDIERGAELSLKTKFELVNE